MKTLKNNCIIALFLLSATLVFSQPPNYPTSADKAQLIYSDVENFITAMDHLEKNTDTIQVLNTYYFEKASAGLKEYIRRHGLTPEMLKNAIGEDPKTYSKIPAFLDGMDMFKGKLIEVFAQFENIVPDTMFAPTYLLVGANRGIAQASLQGQLVTIGRILNDEEKLLKLIVHELAHFQQAKTIGGQQYVALYSQPDNMLGICLREGGAEFITSQVLGSITQEKSVPYYNENEKSLKERFLTDLHSQDNSYWLWDSIGKKDRPQLLGYVMGYKMWCNYLDESGDRDLVVNEILNLTDANKYLETNKYFAE